MEDRGLNLNNKYMTATKEEQSKDLVVKEPTQVVQFNPEQDVEKARQAAKALMSLINSSSSKPLLLGGQRYIGFSDWQTIGQFFHHSVGTESTSPIEQGGKTIGWEAKAVLYNMDGVVVGGAEAACMRDEKNWATKPEFQLRSMAQTRAMAKALRSRFGFVAVLAGCSDTPAEEMSAETVYQNSPAQSQPAQEGTYTQTPNVPKPASEAQKRFIMGLMKQKGVDDINNIMPDGEKIEIGKEGIDGITVSQASDCIKRLQEFQNPSNAPGNQQVIVDKAAEEVAEVMDGKVLDVSELPF